MAAAIEVVDGGRGKKKLHMSGAKKGDEGEGRERGSKELHKTDKQGEDEEEGRVVYVRRMKNVFKVQI